MMSISEVVENVCSITIFRVTQFDNLAKFSPFEITPTSDVGLIGSQLADRRIVQHENRAAAPETLFVAIGSHHGAFDVARSFE
jgi:hypothetical protein